MMFQTVDEETGEITYVTEDNEPRRRPSRRGLRQFLNSLNEIGYDYSQHHLTGDIVNSANDLSRDDELAEDEECLSEIWMADMMIQGPGEQLIPLTIKRPYLTLSNVLILCGEGGINAPRILEDLVNVFVRHHPLPIEILRELRARMIDQGGWTI